MTETADERGRLERVAFEAADTDLSWAFDTENGATLPAPKGTVHVMSGLTPIEEYDAPAGVPAATPEREFVWGSAFPEPLVMIDRTDAGDIPKPGSPGGGEEVLYYLHDVLNKEGQPRMALPLMS